MKKLFSVLLFAFIMYSNISYSDNEYFRTVSSGDWTNGASWEMSTNGGYNWFTSAQYPNNNSGYTELRSGHNVIVPVNAAVTCNQFKIVSGGTLTVLAGGTVTTISDGSFYDLNLESGSTVNGPGIIQTTGVYGGINISTGSNFNAPLRVISGELKLFDAGSTLYANVKGDITVNSGATLYVLGYLGVKAFGNVLNNGTITGTTPFYMEENIFENNGTVNTPNFYFDTTTILKNGVSCIWNPTRFIISASGNLICQNDLIFNSGTSGITVTLKSGAILNPGGHKITVSASPANSVLYLESGSTILDSGLFQTFGIVQMDVQTGANFNLPLIVKGGILYSYSSISPSNAVFRDSVTIDSGAVFSPLTNCGVKVYGPVLNNGGISSLGSFYLKGNKLINNGIIDNYIFNFDTTATLSGTGSFLNYFTLILSGANVTLTSDHQFKSLNINAGGSFDITSKTLKLNGASDPIINNGTFTTAESTIEYNGINTQNFPQLNVDYVNVTFNNPSNFYMYSPASASGLVKVLNGDVNLNYQIFTLQPTATLQETPGNTFKGDNGYIITTRNLNAPANLNVAGMGAEITTSTNLGLTVIKRGHSIHYFQNGLQSAQRYFEINPTNNSILNGSLDFKYDDSELNGITESSLSLYSSTNSGSSYNMESATLNTSTNTLTISGMNSLSKYTAGDGKTGFINLTASIEGLYNISNSQLNSGDTVNVYLRNSTSPFAKVDSAKAALNIFNLTANLTFKNVPSGNYYIDVKQRNSIETYSKTVQSYSSGVTLNYNFTLAQTKAFGDNLTLTGTKWSFYSGDVNQDGIIDAGDLSQVENDANVSLTGYVNSDVTGDDFVDAGDVSLADNNVSLGVSAITP